MLGLASIKSLCPLLQRNQSSDSCIYYVIPICADLEYMLNYPGSSSPDASSVNSAFDIEVFPCNRCNYLTGVIFSFTIHMHDMKLLVSFLSGYLLIFVL